jgi:uncharacterized membrane protein
MKSTEKIPENNRIKEYLKRLEARIERLEEHLNITAIETEEVSTAKEKIPPSSAEASDILEFRIGQFWFARFGIVVLAIGIVFLLTLPYKNLPPAFPSILGYILVGFIFLLSYLLRKSFQFISRYLVGGGLLLLYFSTLRLHFFSIQPAISNKTIELTLLVLIVVFNLYISARRKSIYLSSVNLTLGYVTAIASGSTYFLFTAVTIMSGVVVYFKLRYNWHNLIFYGILLSYFTHLTWFTNNPFLGNDIQLLNEPQINVLFLLGYAVIFAMGSLFRQKDLPENDVLIASTLLNCLGFYVLYLLITITTLKIQFPTFHVIASLIFLLLSIAFWIKEKSKYSTFFYAIFGYIAMSVAIMGYFEKPEYFIWLCWQSLLVIITALWFRSKIIIVTNFFIYLLVSLSYLIFAGELGVVSISFGVVALLSARIMNWQKHRLEIKTELMRNSYLSVTFIMFPYALYHSVPAGYISLSWVAVAIFYYIISRILKNNKYRWMALFTLFLTVIYLFIIGIAKLEPTYRIVSFIVLGLVMLIVSIVYARIKAKSSS